MLYHYLMSVWGPDLFVVSFMLEEHEKMLVDNAHEMINNYNHDLVIGNLFKTRYEEVTFITQKECCLNRLNWHEKIHHVERG